MFTYTLPPELIAHTPAEPRDSARLLQWPPAANQTPSAPPFSALPTLLKKGDLLILNNSHVIPARLFATRPSRTAGQPPVKIELLLHRAIKPNLTEWHAFAKPARKLQVGDVLTFPTPTNPPITASITATITNLAPQPTLTLNLPPEHIPTFLQTHGHTPLPPYIKTPDSPAIRARYQNVYSNPQAPGSVAAPTAGLHFTPQVLENLKHKGVQIAHVTLHVGAGTFLNPTPEQLASGQLHPEYAELSSHTAQAILHTQQHGGNIIAVGTTALRTLETWGQLGCPPQGFAGDTTLLIQPGFTFKVANQLITNFHLPGSSLLLLVSAFLGDTSTNQSNIQALYTHAIQKQFRFYSFGDSSLLTRPKA